MKICVFYRKIRGQTYAAEEVRQDTKRKKNSKGMTLVEMIVTFAVAAIFMAAAAMLVVPAMKMTLEVKGMNRVHDDAAIIMETIVEELSYANCYTGEGYTEGNIAYIKLTDKYPVTDLSDPWYGYYQKIKYDSKGGTPAVMSVTETAAAEGSGRLLITYEEIKDDEDNVLQEKIDWSYGKELYGDNEIKLGFKASGQRYIQVRLTVTNTASGYSYTQETYVRCINVDGSSIETE